MIINLSPYEADRIIPEKFGHTEMGRDLLAQDYILKQLTASLMYPEDELGEEFWDRVHKKAYEEYGVTDIPVNTFNKVWIVPEKAVVYENAETDTAFVVESHLKVMLEEDYFAAANNVGANPRIRLIQNTHPIQGRKQGFAPTISIIREIIIPAIEKEVNEGQNFTQLRQIYHSLILATWFKRNLKESILGKIYVRQNKIDGVDIEDKQAKEKIYTQYIEAFKKGTYDYIKEDYNPETQQIVPRKYFSGGLNVINVDAALIVSSNKEITNRITINSGAKAIVVNLSPQLKEDKSMINKNSENELVKVLSLQAEAHFEYMKWWTSISPDLTELMDKEFINYEIFYKIRGFLRKYGMYQPDTLSETAKSKEEGARLIKEILVWKHEKDRKSRKANNKILKSNSNQTRTLDEAFKIVKEHYPSRDIMGETKLSYVFVEEILKQNSINDVMFVGGAMKSVVLLLALMGKSVVLVNLDASSNLLWEFKIDKIGRELGEKLPIEFITANIDDVDIKDRFDLITYFGLMGVRPDGSPKRWLEVAKKAMHEEGFILIDARDENFMPDYDQNNTMKKHFPKFFPNYKFLGDFLDDNSKGGSKSKLYWVKKDDSMLNEKRISITSDSVMDIDNLTISPNFYNSESERREAVKNHLDKLKKSSIEYKFSSQEDFQRFQETSRKFILNLEGFSEEIQMFFPVYRAFNEPAVLYYEPQSGDMRSIPERQIAYDFIRLLKGNELQLRIVSISKLLEEREDERHKKFRVSDERWNTWHEKEEYRLFRGEIHPVMIKVVEGVAAHMKEYKEDISILDVYGLDGMFLKNLSQSLSAVHPELNFQLSLLDKNEVQLERAKEHLENLDGTHIFPSTDIRYLKNNPDFLKQKFDIITSIGGINTKTDSIEESYQIVENMYELLSEEGVLIISGLTGNSFQSKSLRAIGFEVMNVTVPQNISYEKSPGQIYILKKSKMRDPSMLADVKIDNLKKIKEMEDLINKFKDKLQEEYSIHYEEALPLLLFLRETSQLNPERVPELIYSMEDIFQHFMDYDSGKRIPDYFMREVLPKLWKNYNLKSTPNFDESLKKFKTIAKYLIGFSAKMIIEGYGIGFYVITAFLSTQFTQKNLYEIEVFGRTIFDFLRKIPQDFPDNKSPVFLKARMLDVVLPELIRGSGVFQRV